MTQGFQGALLVREVPGGSYEVIDGAHRFQACKDLGFAQVTVDIVELHDEDVLQYQIMASKHKVPTPPAEYAKQLRRMMTMERLTHAEVAEKLGKSVTWVKNILKETMKIKDIRPAEVAMRSVDRGSPQYKRLTASIRQFGVTQLIRITQDNRIIDGLHRHQACVDLGIEEIKCRVVQVANVTELMVAQIKYSHDGGILVTNDQYQAHLKRIITIDPKYPLMKLSKQINRSRKWVLHKLGVNKVRASIYHETMEGQICLANAVALAGLNREDQADWAGYAKRLGPVDFAMSVNKTIRQKEISASQVQAFRNKSLGIPVQTTIKQDVQYTKMILSEAPGIHPAFSKRFERRVYSGQNPCGEIALDPGINHWVKAANSQDAYEMLHGKDKPIVSKPEPKEQPILRKGWDQVQQGPGLYAYCRGDFLVYKPRANFPQWKIKHPVLRLNNDFNIAEYAMKWIERNFDA
jgi:ParB-like chromosome segregation protein Spo0J